MLFCRTLVPLVLWHALSGTGYAATPAGNQPQWLEATDTGSPDPTSGDVAAHDALTGACATEVLQATQVPRSCTALIDLAEQRSLPSDVVALAHGNRARWSATRASGGGENQLEQALADSNQALALAPGNVRLRINHATVLLAGGHIAEALVAYQRLLGEHLAELEPVVRFNYAIALRASGATQQALRELEAATRANGAPIKQTNNQMKNQTSEPNPLHSGAGLEPRLR